MIPARIAGFTRWLGKPPGWNPEEHGECSSLAVRDIQTAAGNAQCSAWEPTPEELRLLNAGHPAVLGITGLGYSHPPVFLGVSPSLAEDHCEHADLTVLSGVRSAKGFHREIGYCPNCDKAWVLK